MPNIQPNFTNIAAANLSARIDKKRKHPHPKMHRGRRTVCQVQLSRTKQSNTGPQKSVSVCYRGLVDTPKLVSATPDETLSGTPLPFLDNSY